MSGEGARLYGGRWNPQGTPVVYLAESRALAALEILVHAPREALPLDWCVIEVEVPDDGIETVDIGDLPADWRELPSSIGARHFGGARLSQRESLALKLPSAIIPEEHTLLVDPLHPDVVKLRVSGPRTFRFDLWF